jgi:hypothetical protein
VVAIVIGALLVMRLVTGRSGLSGMVSSK